VVLQSFPRPRPTTNPYLIMLGRALDALPDAHLRTFSRRTALLGRYDVFHVHWPETLVTGRTPLRKLARQAFFVALLLRLRLTRTPLVRTLHNLELPQGISRREVALLRWAERWTSLWIRINESTELSRDAAFETILHGHYRDWFAARPRRPVIPGRLTFFGLIRRYKGSTASSPPSGRRWASRGPSPFGWRGSRPPTSKPTSCAPPRSPTRA
jgi:beta-1,4-mannosyltransferase